MEHVLEAGPIPYASIVLYGDVDLEQALRHYGVEPDASSYLVRSGVELPPIVVVRNWRGSGWGLLDGVTRTHALLECGVERTRAYELIQRPE